MPVDQLPGVLVAVKLRVDLDQHDLAVLEPQVLFSLQRGVPTDAYRLDEDVRDGYLVPPRAITVPLKFQREGISYDHVSEEEKEQWDTLEIG